MGAKKHYTFSEMKPGYWYRLRKRKSGNYVYRFVTKIVPKGPDARIWWEDEDGRQYSCNRRTVLSGMDQIHRVDPGQGT